MSERDVIVGYVVEEMDFILWKQQTCSNGVDRRITPSFVEKATVFVKGFEKIEVGLRSKPIEVTDFKVGPLLKVLKEIVWRKRKRSTHEMAFVVCVTSIVAQKSH